MHKTAIALALFSWSCCPKMSLTSLDFSPAVQAGGDAALATTVRDAQTARDNSVIYYFLQDQVRRLPAGQPFVTVEAYALSDDAHGFALVAQTPTDYLIMSNYVIETDPGGQKVVAGVGDVHVYRPARDPATDALFARATAPVQAGFGGLAGVDDGDTFFLLQRSGGVEQRSVLTAVTFKPFEDPPDPAVAPADLPRYEAIAAVWTLWFNVATTTTAAQLITTTP